MCATARASLDFLRAAVFFFITPRLAALSIALYTTGSTSTALVSLRATSSVTCFIASFIARRRRRLKTRRVAACRTDFFPDFDVAIANDTTAKCADIQVCARYLTNTERNHVRMLLFAVRTTERATFVGTKER